MTRHRTIRHEFVDVIPDDLEDGFVYVCIPYATAVHRCCCGCRSEVVTPLSPTDWSLTFDGQSVSLHPSIGNCSFACRSHYWIQRNHVRWAQPWNDTEIAVGRRRDAVLKLGQFASANADTADTATAKNEPPMPSFAWFWRQTCRRRRG